MAINTYPAVASPIKSIQRGSAAGAGTVTINAIDISKSTCMVFGTASSGTVAASAAISLSGTITGTVNPGGVGTGTTYGFGQSWAKFATNGTITNGSLSGSASNLTGGTNNLVAAVVQGYLSNSTSLVVSGACRWEVVEYN